MTRPVQSDQADGVTEVAGISPAELRRALSDGDELALLDVRETPLPEQKRFPAFREYLDWEVSLVAQIEQDGTARFRLVPPEVGGQDVRAAE